MTQNNVGIYASQISGHLWAPSGAYDALASVTLSATTSTITFAGIPTGYRHLQIRGIARSNSATTYPDPLIIQFNGDTTSGNYYSYHILTGDTTAASAYAGATTTIAGGMVGRIAGGNGGANSFTASIIDILDYSNSNKNKTTRTLSGTEGNSTNLDNDITLFSSLWKSTSTITSILLRPNNNTNSFVQYTQFALYGVK